MRPLRLTFVLVLLGLAGCTSTPIAPVPPRPPVEIPQQSSATKPPFTQTGLASFYGAAHDGKLTASGERFDPSGFTAAHRSLALGSHVRVTNLENGQSVLVKITDRGPFVRGRIIDVSLAAAQALGMIKSGVTRVRLEVLGEIPPAS